MVEQVCSVDCSPTDAHRAVSGATDRCIKVHVVSLTMPPGSLSGILLIVSPSKPGSVMSTLPCH